jgi:hypothetical protein
MNSASRIAASALVAAGLLGAGATAANAAPERISGTAQLQAHLAKAVAVESAHAGAVHDTRTQGAATNIAAAVAVSNIVTPNC